MLLCRLSVDATDPCPDHGWGPPWTGRRCQQQAPSSLVGGRNWKWPEPRKARSSDHSHTSPPWHVAPRSERQANQGNMHFAVFIKGVHLIYSWHSCVNKLTKRSLCPLSCENNIESKIVFIFFGNRLFMFRGTQRMSWCPSITLLKVGFYWKRQRALRISSSSSLMVKVGLQQLVTELVTPQTSVCMWKACLANHSSYVHYLPLFRCICTLGGKRQSSIQSTCCGNIKKNVFMQV